MRHIERERADMKSKIFKTMTMGIAPFACHCFTSECGSANETVALAEEDEAVPDA